METFNLPKYSKVLYLLNAETKYYIQTQIEAQETPINRLPLELRLAPAGAANVKVNASKVFLSRECNKGKYRFITGIQETCLPRWFIGNDYEFIRGKKVISLMLFQFQENDTKLEVYYFHKYDKKSAIFRLRFANEIIPILNKRVA